MTACRIVVIVPSAGIEKTKSLFNQSIPALDTSAPPFSKMMTGAELKEFFFVLVRPSREPIIVVSRRDPTGPRTCKKEAVSGSACDLFANIDTGVGAVNFLRDRTVSAEPTDFRHGFKLRYFQIHYRIHPCPITKVCFGLLVFFLCRSSCCCAALCSFLRSYGRFFCFLLLSSRILTFPQPLSHPGCFLIENTSRHRLPSISSMLASARPPQKTYNMKRC